MTDEPDMKAVLRSLSQEDRDWVLCAVDSGSTAKPEHAELAVAVARWRLRRALVLGLPLHMALAVAMGFVGYAVAPTSAGFAFGFVLGVIGFVVYLWWGETWRRRRRALAANLLLAETGEAPPPSNRPVGNEWMMSIIPAWIVTLFVGGVVHLALGGPSWIGVLVFPVALVLFRRLVRATVQSIDDWGSR